MCGMWTLDGHFLGSKRCQCDGGPGLHHSVFRDRLRTVTGRGGRKHAGRSTCRHLCNSLRQPSQRKHKRKIQRLTPRLDRPRCSAARLKNNCVYRFTVISHQRPRGDYVAARAHVAGLPFLTVLKTPAARSAGAHCHNFLGNKSACARALAYTQKQRHPQTHTPMLACGHARDKERYV